MSSTATITPATTATTSNAGPSPKPAMSASSTVDTLDTIPSGEPSVGSGEREFVMTLEMLRKHADSIRMRPVLQKNSYEGQFCELYYDDGTPKGKTPVIVIKGYSQFGLSCYVTEEKGVRKESWTCAFPLWGKNKEPRLDLNTQIPLEEMTTIMDSVVKREVALHGSKLFNENITAERWHDRMLPTAKLPQDAKKAADFGPSFKLNVNPSKMRFKLQTSADKHKIVSSDQMAGRGTFRTKFYWPRVYFGVRGKTYGNSVACQSLYKYLYERKFNDDDETTEDTSAGNNSNPTVAGDPAGGAPSAGDQGVAPSTNNNNSTSSSNNSAPAAKPASGVGVGEKRKADDMEPQQQQQQPPNKKNRTA